MRTKRLRGTAIILMFVLALSTLIGGAIFAGRKAAKAPTVTEAATTFTTGRMGVMLINDSSAPIDLFAFNDSNILGTINTFVDLGTDSVYRKRYGYNKNFPDTMLYFAKDPKNTPLGKNSDGSTQLNWNWCNQNDSNPTGPYMVQAISYALQIEGKTYLPFAAISFTIPGALTAGIIEVTMGQRLYMSDFLKVTGGTASEPTNIYIPMKDGWLQWDAQGRAFFEGGRSTYYITYSNGKVGATNDPNASGVVTQPTAEPIPSEAEQLIENYSDKDVPVQSGTYDGTDNYHCPIEEDNANWTVTDVVKPENGAVAGDYSATVTLKDGFSWADGTTDPKTIYWSVGKGTQSFTFDSELTFEMNDTEQSVPFHVGDENLINRNAEVTFDVKDGEGEISDAVTAEAFGFGEEGELGFTVKRNTQNKAEVTVTVTIEGNENLEDFTENFTVNLDAGAGFYLEGDSNTVYATLEEALAAAKETSNPTIHVQGEVALKASDTPIELPAGLTLVGEENSKLITEGTVFEAKAGLTLKNIAIEGDGAAAVKATGGTLTIDGCTFMGSGLEVAGGEVTVNGTSETTSFAGGGIEVSNGKVNLNGNVSFTDCHNENGGALHLTGGSVALGADANVTVSGCTATKGGAIYVGEGATLDAKEGALSVSSSDATAKGGAIYVAAGATKVEIGAQTAIANNHAEAGNGVYVEDGATLTLSTEAAGITDGIMLGHTEGADNVNAKLVLNGDAPQEGKTIVIEFENAEAQTADATAEYVTGTKTEGGAFTAAELKAFMRVKNAGYTFDPKDDALHLSTTENLAAYYDPAQKTWVPVKTLQDAIEAAAKIENGGEPVKVALYKYTNNQDPDNPITYGGDLELTETLTIPDGANIELCSVTATVSQDGATPEYAENNTDSPFVLKRSVSLTEEMIKVEKGGKLTIGNVILDGGAVWGSDNTIRIKDDGNGGAGTVETNNTGAKAHAPVIVNAGELTLEKGTIRNNDNNWAKPGQGFGSENYGGGVRNEGAGTFTMTGGRIENCYSREGGAIMNVNKPQKDQTGKYTYATQSDEHPTVNIEGGTIKGNVSQMKGAAVQSIYGGAQTNVTGGTFEGNWSLHDLGVLSVEEGASLTAKGTASVTTAQTNPSEGTAAQNQNALYLYNNYGKEAYNSAKAGEKPFIEGTADFDGTTSKGAENAGRLAVSGTPTINGDIHIDASCYVVDVDASGNTVDSDVRYDPYADVSGYTGTGKLKLTADSADGKIAKLPAENTEDFLTNKLDGYGTVNDFTGALEASYTYTYTDGDGAFLAQGSYKLEVKQTGRNELTVTGTCDPALTSITVTVDGVEHTLTVKDGIVSGTIDLTDYAKGQDASTTVSLSLTLGMGDDTKEIPAASVEGVILYDETTKTYTFPTGTMYQNENGNFVELTTDGGKLTELPDDLLVDASGNAVFQIGETQVPVEVGARAQRPTLEGNFTGIQDVTDTAYTLQLKEDGADGSIGGDLEYQLRDKDGNAVTDWVKPDGGRLEFTGLTAGTEYTLYARTPASGSLSSTAVSVKDYKTLTEAQNTAKETFEKYFKEGADALFTGSDADGWTVKDKVTTAQLKAVTDAYDALVSALEGAPAASELLALEAAKYAAAQSAHDLSAAQDWFETTDAENGDLTYENALKQAMEYAAGKDLFEDVTTDSSLNVENLKGTLRKAYAALQALDTGVRAQVEELLTEKGYTFTPEGGGDPVKARLDDPLTAYLALAVKEAQTQVDTFKEEQGYDAALDVFCEQYLDSIAHATSMEEADQIAKNFEKAKAAASAIQQAYSEYTTDKDTTWKESERARLVEEELRRQYEALAKQENVPTDTTQIQSDATAAFTFVDQKGEAKEKLEAALDAILGTVTTQNGEKQFSEVTPEDYMDTENYTVTDEALSKLVSAAQAAKAAIEAVAQTGETADEVGLAGLNKALKEGIQGVIEALASEGDSEAVTGIIEKAKSAVEAVTDGTDKVTDFAESLKENTKAQDLVKQIAEQKLTETKNAAKDAYDEAYKALFDVTAVPDDATVAAAKGAIDGATSHAEAMDALKSAIDTLLETLASEYKGEHQSLVDIAVTAQQNAVDGIFEGREAVPSTLKETVEAAKAAIEAAILEAQKEDAKAELAALANGADTGSDEVQKLLKGYQDQIDGAADKAAIDGIVAEAEAAFEAEKFLEDHPVLTKSPLQSGDKADLAAAKADYEKTGEGALSAEAKEYLNEKAGTGKTYADVIQDKIDEVDGIIAQELEAAKAEAKKQFGDAYEALKGTEGKTEAEAAFENAIADMGTASDVNSQLKEEVNKLLDSLIPAGGSLLVEQYIDGVKENVSGTAAESNGISDLSDLMDGVKDALPDLLANAGAADDFIEAHEVVEKQFGEITEADKDALAAAQAAYDALSDDVKAALDLIAEETGYDSYEGMLEDMHNKAEFEGKKADAKEEVEALLREHDSDPVKQAIQKALEAIEDVEYAQHKEDTTRPAHKAAAEKALDDAKNSGKTLTGDAQQFQIQVNAAIAGVQSALNERKESGCYNDAGKQALQDIFDEFQKNAKAVPVGGEGNKTGAQLLEELTAKAQEDLDNVNVIGVTKGDVKPDGTSKTEGAADYPASHDGSIWGIVTNDATMPGGIKLIIEKADDGAQDAIDSAAKEGKLSVASGNDLKPEELKGLVAGKNIVSTLDIYLQLKQGGKVTQFEGSYKVMILLPAEMRGMEGLTVVYQKADGSLEVYKTTLSEDGKYLEFTTTHFSEFNILASEKTVNLTWLIIVLSVLLFVEIVVLIALFCGIREEKRVITASTLPLALLATILPKGALAACIVLGVAMVAGLVAIVILARKLHAVRKEAEEVDRARKEAQASEEASEKPESQEAVTPESQKGENA